MSHLKHLVFTIFPILLATILLFILHLATYFNSLDINFHKLFNYLTITNVIIIIVVVIIIVVEIIIIIIIIIITTTTFQALSVATCSGVTVDLCGY